MAEVIKSALGGKRPWQGTALGVINIIGTVFAFVGGLLFLVMFGFLGAASRDLPVEAAGMVTGVFGGLAIAGGIFLIALGVLYIFMARGAFKGQKWSPIVSVVFAALGIISFLTNASSEMILTLVLSAFILYLGIVCIKHPFYNRG